MMKQRITIEQFNELSEEQRKRLREWWKPSYGDINYCPNDDFGESVVLKGDEDIFTKNVFPLLSIGQCIELLFDLGCDVDMDHGKLKVLSDDYLELECGKFNWCDPLWEAVKQTL